MPAQHRFANHMQLFSLNSDDAGASLARSVRELFENALDATTPTDAGGSAQGGRIEVSLEEIDGGRFRVRVIDDGRGFGDDELHRVTELFSSSKGRRRRDEPERAAIAATPSQTPSARRAGAATKRAWTTAGSAWAPASLSSTSCGESARYVR